MNVRHIAPEYCRIPHFSKEISKMSSDDFELDTPVNFPIECFVQEKVDGANMGVSWKDGPILRNRSHILKKGYIETNTPAKIQFRSAWNWLHKHSDEIKTIIRKYNSPLTIYGEWMFAKHSIFYDKLPDLFLAYDIWSVEDRKFLAPDVVSKLLNKTSIKYIKSDYLTINSIDDLIVLSERNSNYRDGICEGIVLKTSGYLFVEKSFKVVNRFFERRDDFNQELVKNKISR